MKLGIITYNCQHLKTEQLIGRFIYDIRIEKIIIFGLPFKSRKSRDIIFNHRPNMHESISTKSFAELDKISFRKWDGHTNISNMCEKKVEHGYANIDYDSDYSDICYPNNYDGIDNHGNLMCSKEINTDGARMQLSTKITDQNSMDEIIKNFIR